MCDVTICLIAGKKVSFGKSSMVGGFKEPEQILGEMRWQIIQLVTEEEEETSSPHSGEDEKQTMKEKHVGTLRYDIDAVRSTRDQCCTPRTTFRLLGEELKLGKRDQIKQHVHQYQ